MKVQIYITKAQTFYVIAIMQQIWLSNAGIIKTKFLITDHDDWHNL